MGILPGSAGDVDTSAHFLNSANGTGSQSLAKLPDLDQSTVNTTYQGDLGGGGSVFSNPAGPLGQVFGDVAGLPDAFGQLISRIFGINGPFSNIGQAIGQVEQGIVSGIQTSITLIQSAIAAVQTFINGIVGVLINAYNAIPFLGDIPTAGLPALAAAVQTQQGNQQAAVNTVASSNLGANQAWLAPYAVADVSYPQFMHSAMQVQGITTTASAGTAHTHNIFGTGGPQSGNVSIVPIIQYGTGSSRGSFVTTRVATVYDTVAMYMGQHQVTAGVNINNVFLEVWRKDSAGNITQLASMEVSAFIANTGSTAVYKEFSLPSPIIANEGEAYAVIARNATTNGIALELRAMWREDPGGLFFSGADALLTLHTAAQVATAQSGAVIAPTAGGEGNLFPMPWAMLATTGSVPNQHTYTDNFDNRSTMGPLYVPKSNTPGSQLFVSGNRATFKGTVAGDQLALYTLPVGTDAMLAEANLYSRAISSSTCGVMLCCNRELTQTVYLGVEASLIHLYAGPWNALTQVGLWATGAADAKFSAVSDPSTGIFTILRDGTDVQSWNSAGTVQFGEMFRYGGLRASKSVLVGTSGPGQMDNFTFRDFAG